MNSSKIAFALAATCASISSIGYFQVTPEVSTIHSNQPSFIRKCSDSGEYDLSGNVSNTQKRYKYNIKESDKSKNDLYADACEIFGTFRNLTEEEEEAYAKGMDSLFEDTGEFLF